MILNYFSAYALTGIPCNYTSVGNITSFASGSGAPTSWTRYSNVFTAASTTAIIRFSSATDQSNKDWYVDTVSVTSNTGGSNLLVNGNFENGSSVGWQVLSCSSSCYATVQTSTTCQGGSGWCYNNACTPSTNIQFIEQYFPTTIGMTYNVSFWLLKAGGGVGSGTNIFVNIF